MTPHESTRKAQQARITKYIAVVMIALISVVLDALSKAWAQTALPPTGAVAVVGDFLRFNLGYNTGIAFGLFANTGWPLAVLVSVGILVLLTWAFVSLKNGLPPQRILPLGLILGGAIANMIDRVVDGRVTDFIDARPGRHSLANVQSGGQLHRHRNARAPLGGGLHA